jgi:hypothetical protein
MTSNIRILLAQIATFEQQHRAGLNPGCSALAEFFETARLARMDVDAVDRGFEPPGAPVKAVLPAGMPPRPTSAAVERLIDQVVELTARVPLPVMARAVLDQLVVHDEHREVRSAAPPRAV